MELVTREFTLVGVNPAVNQLTEIAGELKSLAERSAMEHGRDLAIRTAS